MRNLVIAIGLSAAVALGGAFAWQAQAATAGGVIPPAATQATQPVRPAACGGPGRHCPPGRYFRCGRYGQRCWCAPC